MPQSGLDKIIFQDAAGPLIESILLFHDWVNVFVAGIALSTLWSISIIIHNSNSIRLLLEGQKIEFLWTILPAVILAVIVLPSLHLLYLVDEVGNATSTVKTLGHQWY